jgi:hypothetical protein
MERFHNHFKSAQMLTELMDNKFKIGKFKFGLDPLLGLFPYFGDIASLGLSFYIIWIAVNARVPGDKIVTMLGNVLYDFLIGLIPILGDLADFAYKANTRNMRILEEFMEGKYPEARVVGA